MSPSANAKPAGRRRRNKWGANYILTAIQRFTVRTLKFIRWLKNFVYRGTSCGAALARLRHVYATL